MKTTFIYRQVSSGRPQNGIEFDLKQIEKRNKTTYSGDEQFHKFHLGLQLFDNATIILTTLLEVKVNMEMFINTIVCTL